MMIPEPEGAPQPKKVRSIAAVCSKDIYNVSCQVTYPSVIVALFYHLNLVAATGHSRILINRDQGPPSKGQEVRVFLFLRRVLIFKTKPSAGMEVVPYEVKAAPVPLYKPSFTVLNASR